MALVTFDDDGKVIGLVRFGARGHSEDLAVGVEVPARTWHTVIALESGSVLLEVKSGPFDPTQPKDLAPWAPTENSAHTARYLQLLLSHIVTTKAIL
jgi:cupin fold WbuC family metalloprotein